MRIPNAVPIELLMQNFGSHINSRVLLWHEQNSHERVFINGSSGKGKSHILDGMQYVLGKPINNEKEFFHYDEYESNGKKHKDYRKRAKIELKILNCGPEHLSKYQRDEILTIGLEAFMGNKRKNRRYIRFQDGTVKKITLAELKQFAIFDDPLTFIDDQQTEYWVQTSPKQRYEKVAQFMGIETFREDVKRTREEFVKSERRVSKAEDELERAKIDLKVVEEKLNRYKKKEKILEDIGTLTRELEHSKIFETHTAYVENEDEFNNGLQLLEKLTIERESLRNTIKSKIGRIKKLQTQTETLTQERNSLQKKRDRLFVETTNYNNKSKKVISFLEMQGIKKPSLIQEESLLDREKYLNQKMKESESNLIALEREFNEKNEELNSRKSNQIRLNKDVEVLIKELNRVGITCEVLYETLEFQDGMQKWVDSMETLLRYDKFGVVVDEEHREQAEKVNRDLQLDAVLLCPRKEQVRVPQSELRNWTHILKVNPQQVRGETVQDLLHLMLGGTYFASDPSEKEDFLRKRSMSRVICLDGYRYNNYSQRKFLKRPPSYVIGKGAKKKEIERIEQEIKVIRIKMEGLRTELFQKRSEVESLRSMLEYLDLFKIKENILAKESRIGEMEERIKNYNRELANPEGEIEHLRAMIESSEKRKVQVDEEIKNLDQKLMILKDELSRFAQEFYTSLVQWSKLLKSAEGEEDSFVLPEKGTFIGEYEESGYKF
ncbi:MAG: hypothetical protein ACFFD2_05315, partial [Promethearchaeota archaeon]